MKKQKQKTRNVTRDVWTNRITLLRTLLRCDCSAPTRAYKSERLRTRNASSDQDLVGKESHTAISWHSRHGWKRRSGTATARDIIREKCERFYNLREIASPAECEIEFLPPSWVERFSCLSSFLFPLFLLFILFFSFLQIAVVVRASWISLPRDCEICMRSVNHKISIPLDCPNKNIPAFVFNRVCILRIQSRNRLTRDISLGYHFLNY